MITDKHDLWKSIDHLNRKDSSSCPCGLFLYHLKLPATLPRIAGKRFLFMSDFHLRSEKAVCFPGFTPCNGTDWLRQAVKEALAATQPDLFIFGGDLIGSATWINDGLQILADTVPAHLPKIAIPGNWEVRREKWLGRGFWKKEFSRIGFHYLSNETLDISPFCFYGFDDYKNGNPISIPNDFTDSQRYRVILSHNPDTIPGFVKKQMLKKMDLILCGHTHGGQVRIPGFGAIKTSSIYGKRFERGLYVHRITGTKMMISAGLGTTWYPIRFFCQPEAVFVEFV